MFQKIFEKIHFILFLLREGTKTKEKSKRTIIWVFYQNIYVPDKKQLVNENHTTGTNSYPISSKLHPTDLFILISLSFFSEFGILIYRWQRHMTASVSVMKRQKSRSILYIQRWNRPRSGVSWHWEKPRCEAFCSQN